MERGTVWSFLKFPPLGQGGGREGMCTGSCVINFRLAVSVRFRNFSLVIARISVSTCSTREYLNTAERSNDFRTVRVLSFVRKETLRGSKRRVVELTYSFRDSWNDW